MTEIKDPDLVLLTQAALAAGEVALRYFRNDVEVFWKHGGTSPVTAADFAANAAIEECLRPARTDYGWLSEESEDGEARLTAERVFVIDPIDGTRAFIAGKETWVVSVAIVKDGRPVAGVLFAPVTGELFQAADDGTVLKNGVPLVGKTRARQDELVISCADDLLGRLDPARTGPIQRQKTVPSLAYRIAMVADGRFDATLVKANAHDWDIAAAELILNNVGGTLCTPDGLPIHYNQPVPRHGRLIATMKGSLDRILPFLPD